MEPEKPASRLGKDFRLFLLERRGGFADALAAALGVAAHPHEDRAFEDGEHKLRPLVSVRDCDVFVVQSLYGEPEDSAHDKLVKLLFFIGALGDAAARRVTAVVPYLAYARKDRKSKPRDPVGTRYVAQLFEAVGTHCVVTMDVHNLAAFQNAFRCRTEHLDAVPVLAQRCAQLLGERPASVVAPDAGAVKRADAFRERLQRLVGRPIGMAFAEKHRSEGAVRGGAFIGDMDDKAAVIVDDLVSSGTTLARTASMCRDRGATSVIAVATHGVFSPAADRVLADAGIDSIVVTDTLPCMNVSATSLRAKLLYVSVGAHLAETIRRLHNGGSIVELSA